MNRPLLYVLSLVAITFAVSSCRGRGRKAGPKSPAYVSLTKPADITFTRADLLYRTAKDQQYKTTTLKDAGATLESEAIFAAGDQLVVSVNLWDGGKVTAEAKDDVKCPPQSLKLVKGKNQVTIQLCRSSTPTNDSVNLEIEPIIPGIR